MMKKKLALLAALVAVVALGVVALAIAAGAYSNKVTYSGQGLTANGGGSYIINQEICGVANGADTEGPYLLWVLTATGASNADITGPWGTATMTKKGGGTFQFISDWYSPLSSLVGTVYATYDGKVKNVQLTISHGCAPKKDNGAWCSPGYWRNTLNFDPNGWTTIGVTPPGPLYNDVIDDPDLGAPGTGPTLLDVLNAPQTYGGAAFNAVGAYLTNLIPGYVFDPSLVGTEDSCPIDAHGNFK
jgi:hypothetical protein